MRRGLTLLLCLACVACATPAPRIEPGPPMALEASVAGFVVVIDDRPCAPDER
ncbi:MAG: hypothetical protein ACYSWX_00220 [Planctomycetota bacterium]|jgi:hypothetical protein